MALPPPSRGVDSNRSSVTGTSSHLTSSRVSAPTFSTLTSHTRNSSTTSRSCWECGSYAHIARHCDQPKKCFKCGLVGHLIKDCPRQYQEKHGRAGRRAGESQNWKLGHVLGSAYKVQSIFEKEYGDLFDDIKQSGDGGGGAENPADLIDLASPPQKLPQRNTTPANPRRAFEPTISSTATSHRVFPSTTTHRS